MSLATRRSIEEVIQLDDEVIATYLSVFDEDAEEARRPKRKPKAPKELDPKGEEALNGRRQRPNQR